MRSNRLSNPPRILIAGVGNIFLGDDGFGVEVVKELRQRELPTSVRVVDFGIRGLDLTYALLDGYDAVILIDAVQRGNEPGHLSVLEPDEESQKSKDRGRELGDRKREVEVIPQGHNLDPASVLRLAAAMGSRIQRLLVVGCEPTPLDEFDGMSMSLSDPVLAAVPEAVVLVESLVTRLIDELEGKCYLKIESI